MEKLSLTVKTSIPTLQVLFSYLFTASESKHNLYKTLLRDKKLLNSVTEIFHNLIRGTFSLRKADKAKFRPYQHEIFLLANKKTPHEKRYHTLCTLEGRIVLHAVLKHQFFPAFKIVCPSQWQQQK